MTDDRLDALLARALDEGQVPADATPAERAEIERLLALARNLEVAGDHVEAEASNAMPAARERFGAFVTGASAHGRQPLAVARRRRPLRRLVTSAAALAAVIVLAIGFVIIAPFGDEPRSAYASVLDPGDYLQLEAVVEQERGDDSGQLTVRSEFGSLDVLIEPDTAIVHVDDGRPRFAPGRPLLVSGVVDSDGRLRATTISLSEGHGDVPEIRAFARPRGGNPLEGNIVWFSQSGDDGEGLVAVVTPSGDRLLAPLERDAVADLVRLRLAGQGQVELVPGRGAGEFAVRPHGGAFPGEIGECQGQPSGALVERVCGTVAERDASSITLDTDDGPVTASLTPRTRFIPAPGSGLERQGLTDPAAGIGHRAAVAGVGRPSGGLVADVVLFGSLAPAD